MPHCKTPDFISFGKQLRCSNVKILQGEVAENYSGSSWVLELEGDRASTRFNPCATTIAE